MAERSSQPEFPKGRLRVLPGGATRRAELSDSELIDSFERGEGRACEELYDRLVGVVEATLWRVLGGRDEHHDDLVQAAFEQIVLTLTRRKFARACSLASWAATVTTHVAFNAIRTRTRERRVLDRTADGDAEARDLRATDDVERDARVRQALARVRHHLAAMNEEKATTVLLHDVLGHELAEIAVLTGVTVAAAQSRLVRGRKELHERLRKEGLVTRGDES